MNFCLDLIAEQKHKHEQELSEFLDHDGLVIVDSSFHGRFVKSRLQDEPALYTVAELWGLERHLYQTLTYKLGEDRELSFPTHASVEFARGIQKLARSIDDPVAALRERWWPRQQGMRELPVVETSYNASDHCDDAAREAKACVKSMQVAHHAFRAFPAEAYIDPRDMQYKPALTQAIEHVARKYHAIRDYGSRHRNGSAHSQHQHHDLKMFRTAVLTSYRHYVTKVGADSDTKRLHRGFYKDIHELSRRFGFPIPEHRLGLALDWKDNHEIIE